MRLTEYFSGIDLASPKELIAHQRDRFEIAKHIGADEVIFQDLDDLVDACAELSPKGAEPAKFEVGVFCGKYITDVPPGYFEHLDEIRGKKRKIAVAQEMQVPAEAANGRSSHLRAPPGAAKSLTQGAHNSTATLNDPPDRADIRYVVYPPISSSVVINFSIACITLRRSEPQLAGASANQSTASKSWG